MWSLPVGSKIAGRYAIQQPTGKGAFGEVYQAYDELLGRIVALKTLLFRDSYLDAGASSEFFLQEARTVAKLDHPNIVPVYDAGIENSIPWMVVRFVQGESLAQLLAKEGKLTVDRAIPILVQAARALEHAHRNGIIHRDVKPSNILLEKKTDHTEHAWLTDFGIARILAGGTTVTDATIVGTPSYMSPEQVTGKRVDARADIFALGSVAYELVTGTLCFRGKTWSQLIYNVVHQQPEHIAEVGRVGGPQYEAVVRRALAKSPEDRYQTGAALAAALETIGKGEEIGQARRLWPPIKKIIRGAEACSWNGQEAIIAENVRKAYRPRRNVLNCVTLRVQTGSIYALLGRNGSGKTTLIRSLLGLYKIDAGHVAVFGRNPVVDHAAILARIGYVPESPTFYLSLKVSELLQFLSRFYPQWDHSYCYQLLGRFELPLDVKLRDLSRGAQTKVSLLAALAHRPELLVLDDPTLGLDAVVLQDFFDTLRDACRREGTTIFIASHNLEEVEHVATHIGFLREGRIMLSGTLDELRMRTRQVRLKFRDGPPDLGRLEHFRVISSSGARLTGVVLDTSSGVLEQLKAFNPEEMEVRQLTLKEIFVSFLR